MKVSLREVCRAIAWHPNFWNPTKLFSKKDMYGKDPGIFCAISNRTGGKTYGVGQVLMKYHDMTSGKFGLICKNQSDLGMIARGVLGAVIRDKYPGWEIVEEVSKTKRFSVLKIRHLMASADEETGDPAEYKEEELGFVFALNAASKLKDYSSLFVDVDILFMDEFQTEQYLSNEIDKIILLMGSIARGGPDGVRYVPLIMCSNSLSIENPYFTVWGVVNKLQSDTKFYRGDGLVIQRFTNEIVAEAQRNNPFNRAFKNAAMIATSVDNSWLNDDYSCVSKIENDWGKSIYMATLTDGDQTYGVRKYDCGIYYISRSIDSTCPTVFAVSVDGMENVPILKTGLLFQTLRKQFARGNVRFSDLTVKNIIYRFII